MVQQPAERRQSPESTSEPAQHQSEQSRQNKPLQLSPAMATAILKQVLPHVPSMFYKSATHVLSLSPTAQHWDLRSTLVLEVVRAFVRTPPPGEHTVEKAQRASIKPQKVDNETVKIDVKYGVEDDEEKRLLEEAVRNAICSLGEQGLVVDPVGVEPLTAEWVGRRLKKGDGSMHLGEKERFEVIEKGVKDDRTILVSIAFSFPSPGIDGVHC